jgi:hypothetical protein
MKDLNKERWEIPEEILNNEYLQNINDNITNETYNFKIEYIKFHNIIIIFYIEINSPL